MTELCTWVYLVTEVCLSFLVNTSVLQIKVISILAVLTCGQSNGLQGNRRAREVGCAANMQARKAGANGEEPCLPT
jgi:hypothetical protein